MQKAKRRRCENIVIFLRATNRERVAGQLVRIPGAMARAQPSVFLSSAS
jgi:hypothetical protein